MADTNSVQNGGSVEAEAPHTPGTRVPTTGRDVVELAELQKAIEEITANGDLPEVFSSLLLKLGAYVGNVSEKLDLMSHSFDTLSSQVGTMSDEFQGNVGDIDNKVHRLCIRMGVKMKPSSSTGRKWEEMTDSGRKDAGASKKIPVSQMAAIMGREDPLAMTYEFPFHVGDITFNCVEQALKYIRCRFLGEADTATKVKAATDLGRLMKGVHIPESAEWDAVVEDVTMALLQDKLSQCEEFEKKLRAISPDVAVICNVTFNKVWGTGASWIKTQEMAPENFPGKNLFGKILKKFRTKLEEGLPNELPFDTAKYCICENVNLSADQKILVLADVQLSEFKGKFNTELVCDPTLCAVTHPKSEIHTAKKQIEDIENLGVYGAIVLIFGTYEVGKDPETIEKDYTELLDRLVEVAVDIPIYVCNAFPRFDKHADSLKLANYAIQIAARKNPNRVHLIDMNEKLGKGANRAMFKPNGFQIGEPGFTNIIHILAEAVPFVTLIPPVSSKPPPKQGVTKSTNPSSSSAGGPSAKRARRGSTSVSPGFSRGRGGRPRAAGRGVYGNRGAGRGASNVRYSVATMGPGRMTPTIWSSPFSNNKVTSLMSPSGYVTRGDVVGGSSVSVFGTPTSSWMNQNTSRQYYDY